MSDRQTLTMRNITVVIREVTEWREVGVKLGIKPYKLEEIRLNRMNDVQHCKFSLIDHWLRTDLQASWAKLATALDECDERGSADKIRQQYLSGHVGGAGMSVGANVAGAGQMAGGQSLAQQRATHGIITSDSPQSTASVVSQVPVPISGQAPIVSVTDAVPLLRTSQEKLISGLTHSKLDVNFTGNTQNMTLLHYAAMQGADMECLKGLIAFGANINPLNSFGQTPLDLAAMSHIGAEMVGLLETIGAKSGVILKNMDQQLPVRPRDAPLEDGACNILTMCSSGPYCIVQLETLQQIEVHSGCKVTTFFQWMVACGFGALFLLLMVYGNKTMADVKRLYFKLREEVFSQRDMARRSQALDGFLQAHLGTQMKMSDIQHPRILIGAVYKGSTKVEIRLFNNYLKDDLSETPVWKVARYTCSLPLNIMESDNYMSTDSALPNISTLGLRRIGEFYGDLTAIKSLVCVGAGQFDAQEIGCVDVPVSALSENPQWFSSQGALVNVSQLLALQQCSAIAAGEESLLSCQEQCHAHGIQFFLFNPILSLPMTLSVDVNLKQVVDSVIETIGQICGKPIDSLVTFLNNN